MRGRYTFSTDCTNARYILLNFTATAGIQVSELTVFSLQSVHQHGESSLSPGVTLAGERERGVEPPALTDRTFVTVKLNT